MLTISRPDIDRYFITEYPVQDRFIKLPVENYLKLLTWEDKSVFEEINRPQIALINAINNPKYRFVCAALSRRLGKTFIANIIAQLVVLVPGCNVLIMSPNYNLSSISFDLQRRLLRTFDIEVAKDNLKDKVVELKNGSTIRMGSISTVDSCVGRSYNLIVFDEAALGADAENAFNVALRPTLDRPGSKAIFISTPRGKKNWFSKFHRRGFSADFPQWVSLHADYTENDRMTEADVAEAKASMSKAEFEQEYLASFTTFEGRIYDYKDTATIPFEWKETDRWEFFGGLDPGYKDHTAFCVIGYNSTQDYYHIVAEYMENEGTTKEHAEKIGYLVGKWGIDSLFIDPAAAQFAADLAYTYDIASLKAKKDVLPGIAYCQVIISQGRLKVDPDCVRTLEMLDQYQWDTRETLTTEKPLHNEFSHMADAVRYALYTMVV